MLYYVYCDESRQSKDRYMVIGGFILTVEDKDEFYDTIKKYREEQRMFAELKWTKVTQQKLPQYKRFIEYFFALNNTDKIHYHCIIIDNHQVDHKKFSKGDKELGFYKFYYQLLLHSFGRRYCSPDDDDRFIVILDYRVTSYKLNTLKVVLNRGMNKRYSIDSNPFVSIEPRRSKKDDILQIADIIIGSIGFQKNGYDLLAGTRKAKKELANFIASQAGLPDLKSNTPWGNHRFTIWNFRLQK